MEEGTTASTLAQDHSERDTDDDCGSLQHAVGEFGHLQGRHIGSAHAQWVHSTEVVIIFRQHTAQYVVHVLLAKVVAAAIGHVHHARLRQVLLYRVWGM